MEEYSLNKSDNLPSKKGPLNEINLQSVPFQCHFCGGVAYWDIVDLGHQPLANAYLENSQKIEAERSYALNARVCESCHLAQVDRVVPAEDIFSNYSYFSSFSTSWVEHARTYCVDMIERFDLDQDALVVEIASNDGYLLRHFLERDIPILGVEPAGNIAKIANKNGIRTVNTFFNAETAEKLVNEGHQADLIAANNVLAHVPDINGFVAGFPLLLKPGGILTVEFHHLLELIEQNQFDTIYHEHFSYLSLEVVERIFARHGLRVFDVTQLSTHGGSLRVFACREDGRVEIGETESLRRVRMLEENAGLHDQGSYTAYGDKVRTVRAELLSFLAQAKADKKTVVAYGAAAKGNTLLNFCNITTEDIAYVVDKNPHKQNCLLPGSHLSIVPAEQMRQTKPDYVLILPWNLSAEISAEHSYIREWGGQFVRPIPALEILP